MTATTAPGASKLPEVTLAFWIIKIAATTLGETGGDTVTMTLRVGLSRRHRDLSLAARWCSRYAQIAAANIPSVPLLGDHRRLNDSRHDHGGFRRPLARHRLCRRIVGLVLSRLLAVLGLWYWSLGTISVGTVNTPKG